MKNILQKIITSTLLILAILAVGFLKTSGSTIPIAPSLFETSLASPIGKTDTSMTLASGILANGSTLSGYTCFTVDSGNPNVEFICGTASGTSITSLLRGVDTLTGNSSTSTLQFTHRRGADVKITDFPVFTIVRNIMAGVDSLPSAISYKVGVSPLGSQDLTTKAYVLSVVNGGTVSTNQIVVTGTAGETVAAGNIIYLKSDGYWWKAKANDTTTFSNTELGIAQGAGTAGNTISNGVLIRGVDTNNTGTVGNLAYISNTGGNAGTSAGTYTKVVGQFLPSNTGLELNPAAYLLYAGVSQGIYTSQNKLIAQDQVYTADSDQSQTTQNATVEFGMANTTGNKNKIQQSFIPTKTKIRGARLYKSADTGIFTGTVTVALFADTAGSPSGSALGTVTITNAQWLALPVGEFEAIFTSEYASMTQGSTYWIQASASTADNANHPNLGDNTAGGYTSGSVKYWNTTDTYVAVANVDLYFKTLQGVSSQVAYISKIPTTQIFTLGSNIGDSTTQFTVSNISGSIWRYTYTGVGTNPNITPTSIPVGMNIQFSSSNSHYNLNNILSATVLASGTNYFQITSPTGYAETVTLGGGGYLILGKTYTKPAGVKYLEVETVDGGNGGDGFDIGNGGNVAGEIGGASSFSSLVNNTTGDLILSGNAGSVSPMTSCSSTNCNTKTYVSGQGGLSFIGTYGKGGSSYAGWNNLNFYGGTGGTYSRKILSSSSVPSSVPITIGAGGGNGNSSVGGVTTSGTGNSGVVIIKEFYY